jgi:hypothetical protein
VSPFSVITCQNLFKFVFYRFKPKDKNYLVQIVTLAGKNLGYFLSRDNAEIRILQFLKHMLPLGSLRHDKSQELETLKRVIEKLNLFKYYLVIPDNL